MIDKVNTKWCTCWKPVLASCLNNGPQLTIITQEWTLWIIIIYDFGPWKKSAQMTSTLIEVTSYWHLKSVPKASLSIDKQIQKIPCAEKSWEEREYAKEVLSNFAMLLLFPECPFMAYLLSTYHIYHKIHMTTYLYVIYLHIYNLCIKNE